MARVAALAFWVALCCVVPGRGWILHNLSFDGSLTFDDGLDNWLCSASTVALKNSVCLMPDVSDRHGIFWNKLPATSSDVEVVATLRLTTTKDMKITGGEEVALWLVADNYTASYDESRMMKSSWSSGLEVEGLTLIANKPTFRGVLFSLSGKQLSSTMSAVFNAGDGIGRDTLVNNAVPCEYRNNVLTVSISVQGGFVTVKGKAPAAGSTPACSKTWSFSNTLAGSPSWYFGVTGYSGSPVGTRVDIERVEATSNDLSYASKLVGDEDHWVDALASNFHFISQQEQTDAIHHLIQLLSDNDEFMKVTERQYRQSLMNMMDRLDRVDSKMAALATRAKAFNRATETLDTRVLRSQMQHIAQLLRHDKEVQDTKLTRVDTVAKTLQTEDDETKFRKSKLLMAAQKFDTLQKSVGDTTSTAGWLVILLVMVLGGLICAFVQRMRYLEKHHYV